MPVIEPIFTSCLACLITFAKNCAELPENQGCVLATDGQREKWTDERGFHMRLCVLCVVRKAWEEQKQVIRPANLERAATGSSYRRRLGAVTTSAVPLSGLGSQELHNEIVTWQNWFLRRSEALMLLCWQIESFVEYLTRQAQRSKACRSTKQRSCWLRPM